MVSFEANRLSVGTTATRCWSPSTAASRPVTGKLTIPASTAPWSSQSRTSCSLPSSNRMVTAGCRWANVRSCGAMNVSVAVGRLAKLSVPVTSPAKLATSVRINVSCRTASRACVSATEPASVSESPSRRRTNNRNPRSFSNVAMARLTAGCDSPSRRPAAVKRPLLFPPLNPHRCPYPCRTIADASPPSGKRSANAEARGTPCPRPSLRRHLGEEAILFRLAEAAVENTDDIVRERFSRWSVRRRCVS